MLLARACVKTQQYEYFVDIGAGKGKPCIYAYTKRYFRKIIGLEFSADLIAVAEENKKINDCDIAFVNGDACDYILPKGKCLFCSFLSIAMFWRNL